MPELEEHCFGKNRVKQCSSPHYDSKRASEERGHVINSLCIIRIGIDLDKIEIGGRFDRMVRTDWINIHRIHQARVLVAGAGALGNEAVKCLTLAGFRDLTIVDPDTIEKTNLSRCVLFREGDIGRSKAEVASEAASDLDKDCVATPIKARIQTVDLSSFDVYVGCLDNVSARLHLNSHAKYYGIPYVDGSTDGFRGKVMSVLRTGPCLECTMNRTHVEELHRTFSCVPGEVMSDSRILSSGVTTTSVIAAACVREIIKIVCGCERLCVIGLNYYDGIKGTMEVLDVDIDPRCPNHGDINDIEHQD